MTATCQCNTCYHEWNSRVVSDEPDVNFCEVEDSECPKCGSDDFSIGETSSDEPDYIPEDDE